MNGLETRLAIPVPTEHTLEMFCCKLRFFWVGNDSEGRKLYQARYVAGDNL